MSTIFSRSAAFLLLGLIAVRGFAGVLPEQWVGAYSYQYVMGHRKGELAPAWIFDLTIRADGTCDLIWEGFQVDDHISCTASGSDRYANIYFDKSSSGDDTADTFGGNAYAPGALLMQLRRGSRGRLQTKWGALDDSHTLKDGVRFERY